MKASLLYYATIVTAFIGSFWPHCGMSDGGL